MARIYEQEIENREEDYQKYDTVIGKVIGYNSYGCFVRDMKTDKIVFYFGNGMKGDMVQLSVKRIDTERKRVTCSLDSVLEYGNLAA